MYFICKTLLNCLWYRNMYMTTCSCYILKISCETQTCRLWKPTETIENNYLPVFMLNRLHYTAQNASQYLSFTYSQTSAAVVLPCKTMANFRVQCFSQGHTDKDNTEPQSHPVNQSFLAWFTGFKIQWRNMVWKQNRAKWLISKVDLQQKRTSITCLYGVLCFLCVLTHICVHCPLSSSVVSYFSFSHIHN